jgi:mono/diheme cytochrome c family protein
LEAEKQTLLAEWREGGTTRERRQAIQDRVREINTTLIDTLGDLETQNLNLRAAMQNAVTAGYNPDTPSRLEQLGWGGTLESFLFTTLVHGRPTSGAYWPQAMPAWSQRAGGPLRNDELQDLANYILNFDKGADWTMEDLLAVKQFAIVPGAEAVEVEGAVGTDVEAIVAELETVTGDAAKGRAIYNGQEPTEGGQILPCSSCHLAGSRGPDVVGTWSRVNDERLSLDQFAGYTPEHYLVESIVNPNAYVVESFAPGVMPDTFGAQLTLQDMADLIAYLRNTG